MVLGHGTLDKTTKEAQQVSLDMYMMRGCGFEQEECEWKKVIMDAGFNSYTIMSLLDPMSTIRVLP